MIEFITCSKCKIQQRKENFWYCSFRHKVCKSCNKKTNIVPSEFKVTTEEILQYLNKIVYDPKNDTSILFQTQMNTVFEFLERQNCREMEEFKYKNKPKTK